MLKALPAIAVLGLALAAHTAHAAAPQLVPVQGVLTDSSGTPIDSSVTAVFSLYTSEVGGTALWSETQSVLVEDGLFTAYMGDVTTLDLSLFRDNDTLWLGIQIDSDTEMDRVMLGTNPFAGYAEHCGSAPAPDFADITGTVDPADLPAGLVAGPLACTGTEKVSGVDSSGALVCSADTDTAYTAGTGLTLTGTTFSLDTSSLQVRVTGTCPSGQSIREIAVDGSVTCEIDTDTLYTAGTGLILTGTNFTVDTTALQARVTGTCASGQAIRAILPDGTVGCELDNDTTYSAGTGLLLSGTTFSVNQSIFQRRVNGTCGAGNSIRVINSDGTVVCEVDTDTNTTYSAGTGLVLAGTTFSADATYLQRRVTGTCASGSAIRFIDGLGAVACEPVGTGDIEGVIASTGLTGGGTSGTVAISANTTYLQRRVTGTCGINTAMYQINADGTVYCMPVYTGDINTVAAGTGLTGGGTSGAVTLNADTTYLQRRVVSTCPVSSAIRAISETGAITCQQVYDGDVTEVIAGTGLIGGGTSGAVTLSIGSHAKIGFDYRTATAVLGDNYVISPASVVVPLFSTCIVTATAWFTDQEPADDGSTSQLRTARLTVDTGTQEKDPVDGPYTSGTGVGQGRPATAIHDWSAYISTTYRFGCHIAAPIDSVDDTINCRVSWICHPY